MQIEVKSFMGRIGFELRRRFPKLSSFLYIHLSALLNKEETRKYIMDVMNDPEGKIPLFIHIETINRCNGTCPFCPANVNDETRPLVRMKDELFKKIIDDLVEIKYKGVVCLYCNNEPFLDKRMEDMLWYTRKALPGATILIFTNGTLLTPERLGKIDGAFDQMYVNNYYNKYELTTSSQVIYDTVKKMNSNSDSKITIQLRYANEYLTNRAGTAPNKKGTKRKYKWQCIMPYTDMIIFPDGKVGLCCNDTKEITDFGNVEKDSVIDVFRNDKLIELRKKLLNGRQCVDYCQNCDVFDSGIRLRFINKHIV